MLPLYDNIIKSMDGTEELLNGEYCSKISMMDGEYSENIYLIILHHFNLSNKNTKQLLLEGKENPFASKSASKDGKGLIFKVSFIPEELQRIIVRYLKMII
jgi:hypothetical protein